MYWYMIKTELYVCKLKYSSSASCFIPRQHSPPLLPLTLLLEASSSLLVMFLYLEFGPVLSKGRKCSWRLSLRSNSTTGWKSMCKRATMIRHFWHHHLHCWFTSTISIHIYNSILYFNTQASFWHQYTILVCKISSQLQNYVSYWQTLICGFVVSWWRVMMLHCRLQEK